MLAVSLEPAASLLSEDMITIIISVFGVIVSGIVSIAVSKHTANKELEKLRMSWDREDIVSSDEEFSAMAASVAEYVGYCSDTNRNKALAQVASVRAKEKGVLGNALDSLYSYIYKSEYQMANTQLTEVIMCKRQKERDTVTGKGKKPKK